MKRCLITNFSLDGCICKMLLTKIYEFNKILCCGYSAQYAHFKDGDLFKNASDEPYDNLITASIALRNDMFSGLVSHYGNKLSVVDHHKVTATLLGSAGASEAKFNYEPTLSSSESIYNAIMSVGKVDVGHLQSLCKLATVYEHWQVDEPNWKDAYNLNELFWHYNYFKFYDMFIERKDVIFNDDDLATLRGIMAEKDAIINKSVKEEFGDNSVLFLNSEQKVVADYTLKFPKYMLYYVIHGNKNGFNTIAVRKGRNCSYAYSVGRIIRESLINNDKVYGSGHDRTGSITFARDTNLDEMLDIIEKINNKLEGKDDSTVTDDMPFMFGHELRTNLCPEWVEKQEIIRKLADAGHGVKFDNHEVWNNIASNDPIKEVLANTGDW